MPEIDNLNIKIKSEATLAIKSLNNLSRALAGIETGALTRISNGLSGLSNAMQRFKNVNSSDLAKVAGSIQKISAVNSTGIDAAASAISRFSSSLSGMGNIATNSEEISKIISGIAKFGHKNFNNAVANIPLISKNLTDFVRAMNGIGSINFNVDALNGLISGIAKLGGAKVSQAAANLPPISAQLQNFIRQLNGIGSLSFDTTNLNNLVSGISKLGGKSVTNAVANIPQLATALKNLMTTLASAPQVSQNVIQMTTALANLASQGRRAGTASNALVNSMGRTKSSMDRARRSSLSLAAAFGKFYATWFLAIRFGKKWWSAIKSSMNYIETLNYFNAAFEQVASKADLSNWEELGYKSAEAYANSFSERAKQLTEKMSGFTVGDDGSLKTSGNVSLGINPEKLMNYQAMFGQMASSMGVTSENAVLLSQVLSEIGADLASVKNMDFEEVWQNMASGLTGMSRTLDKYGVNIRNVNLQQKLTDLGIQANIANLNQQDKALLRTIVLLDSTRYAWGDLADTIEQPANQLRLLQSNFQNLSRTIGNLFIPIIQKTLPYINGLVIALQRLAQWLAELLGIDLSGISSAISGIDTSDFINDIDDATDAIGAASDAADKLKKGIRGFDELNLITTKEDTDIGKGAEIDSGLLDDAFLDAVSEYQKRWDEAFANLENKADSIAQKILKTFEPLKKLFSDLKIGDFFSAGQDVSDIVVKINTALKNALKKVDWKGIGKKIGDFLRGIRWLDILKSVGELIWTALESALDVWKSAFSAAPIETGIITALMLLKWTGIGKIIANGIAKSLPSVIPSALSKSLDKILPVVSKGLVGVGIGFGEFFAVSDAIKDIAEGTDHLAGSIGELIAGVGLAGAAFTAVFGFPVGLIATAVVGIIGLFHGLHSAIDEVQNKKINESIEKVLVNPDGIPLEKRIADISQQLSNTGESFSVIKEKSKELEEAKENVKLTVLEIEKIKENMDLGVESVEEAIPKLIDAFDKLEDAVRIKLGTSTDIIIAALGPNGTLTKYYGLTEERANQVVQNALGNDAETIKRFNELEDLLSSLTPYTEEWNKAYSELLALSNGVDALAESTERLKAYENVLDFSSYIDVKTKEFDIDKFKGDLNELFDLANKAADEFKLAQDTALSAAISKGDQDLINFLTSTRESALAAFNEENAKIIKQFTDQVQVQLVEGFSESVSSAKLSDLNSFERIFAPFYESDYKHDVAKKYIDKILKPISEEMEIGFEQIGLEGAGWAENAAKNISDALFKRDGFVWKFANEELKEDFANIMDEKTREEVGKQLGKPIVDGMLNGIETEVYSNYAKEHMYGVSNEIIEDFKDKKGFDINSPSKKMEPTGEDIILGIFEGFKLVNFSEKMKEWWNENVRPWFSLEMWSGLGENIQIGLTTGFNNAISAIRGLWNEFALDLNKMMNFSWESIKIEGKEVVPSGNIELGKIPTFKSGGFLDEPRSYSLFKAGEDGIPEMIGTVGGKSAVVGGQEITGISDTIRSETERQNELLRQQNQLLQALLEKDTGISPSDLLNSVRKEAYAEYRRTGENQLVF